jgi:hypothetical protein
MTLRVGKFREWCRGRGDGTRWILKGREHCNCVYGVCASDRFGTNVCDQRMGSYIPRKFPLLANIVHLFPVFTKDKALAKLNEISKHVLLRTNTLSFLTWCSPLFSCVLALDCAVAASPPSLRESLPTFFWATCRTYLAECIQCYQTKVMQ